MNNRNDLIKDDLEDLQIESKISLLCIIDKRGIKKTRLQKVTFLVDKIFRFGCDAQPHYYGPFIEELVEQIQSMVDEGVVYEKDGGYDLTKYGLDLASELTSSMPDIYKFISLLKPISDKEIVKMVYLLFPEYTDKSLIVGKLPDFPNLHVKKINIKDIGSEGISFILDGEKLLIKRSS